MSDESTIQEVEDGNDVNILQPIIVNLGKQKKKKIKALMRGEGPLIDEVEDVLELVAEHMKQPADGATLVPVILVYKEKQKNKLGIFGL